jgi:hypothetical protein
VLRGAGRVRLANGTESAARGLLFVSGDIHVDARFTIACADPAYQALALTSSGISTIFEDQPVISAILDTDFVVAPGIHCSLLEVVNDVNFGIVHVIPTGSGAEIQGVVAHRGNSLALGLDITLYL